MRIVKGYASIPALAAAALGKSKMPNGERSSHREGAWYGELTLDEAIDATKNGDTKGAKRLSPAALKCANDVVTQAPRLDVVFAIDEGRQVDVARYLNGEPECWMDMIENAKMPRRGVSIVINTVAHSGISAKSIDAVGVQLGGSILGLQAMGYSVAVYTAMKNNCDGEMIIHAPLNPGGGMIDIAYLSTIMRSWYLRRIMFAIWETMPKNVRNAFNIYDGGGYGRPGRLNRDDVKLVTGADDAISIDVEDYVRDPEYVRRKIMQAVDAKQGATV